VLGHCLERCEKLPGVGRVGIGEKNSDAGTVLLLLALTIGFGDSVALRSPMAIAVIGGLITSTLLTLVVIPSVYYVFESTKDRFTKN